MARLQWEHEEEDLRRSSVDEQAREAARRIHALLGAVRTVFDGVRGSEASADDNARAHELAHQLDAEIVLLSDPVLRSRLEDVSVALWWAGQGLTQDVGAGMQQIAFTLMRGGQELIGANLRREPLPSEDDSPHLRSIMEYAAGARVLEAQVDEMPAP